MYTRFFNPYVWIVKNPGPIAKEIRHNYFLSTDLQIRVSLKFCIIELLPVIRYISDYLSPIDLINLTKTCHTIHSDKGLYESILPSFYCNLIDLLNEGGHYDVSTYLPKLLVPGLSVLSGSIVLQAILGVRWENSDVDFYCHSGLHGVVVHQFLEFFCYSRITHEAALEDSYFSLMSSTNHILHVHDYFGNWKTSSSKIQVIDLCRSYPAESCVEHFDLDIVQNWFNGKQLFIQSTMSITKKIAIVQHDTQLVSQTIGRATGSLVNVFLRLQKLHDDGLIYIGIQNWNPENAGRILKSVFLRIFSRYKKYISRGFYVDDKKYLWDGDNVEIMFRRLRRNNVKMNGELRLFFLQNHL